MLCATVRVTGDLDVAEECAQEAYVSALRAWTRDGVPERPGAWLTTAARNRALDWLLREVTPPAQAPAARKAGGHSVGVIALIGMGAVLILAAILIPFSLFGRGFRGSCRIRACPFAVGMKRFL